MSRWLSSFLWIAREAEDDGVEGVRPAGVVCDREAEDDGVEGGPPRRGRVRPGSRG